MNRNITCIFLDVGNTLRLLVKDEAHQAEARRKIATLIETTESPDALIALIDARYKIYRKWAFENLAEASEAELWTRWMLPDYPPEKIAPLGHELTYQYRQSMGRRVMQREGARVVMELDKRGYILGIISNVITTQEIPDWLEADGLSQYFKSVVLSSQFGKRKPDTSIYLDAASRARVLPAQCVYVGDNPSRDVIGTGRAGFGMAILLLEPGEEMPGTNDFENTPDVIIHDFCELLDVFPTLRDVN
jgi:putative hydrolase of the HAD superfamily